MAITEVENCTPIDYMYITNAFLFWYQTRERSAYEVLVGKSDRNRAQGKIKRRWYDNIRMDRMEVERKFINWIHSVHATDQWWASVKTATNFEVRKNAGNFLTS
jgi:hypothetical protein